MCLYHYTSGMQLNSSCATYIQASERATSHCEDTFSMTRHLPIFPHKAWVDPRSWFSDTFPSVPSGGIEPVTLGLKVRRLNR